MNRLLLAAALSLTLGTTSAAPYTYRGTLNSQGTPLDGTIDLRLIVVDATGQEVGVPPIERRAVRVTDGHFEVDFNPGVLSPASGPFAVRAELRGADGNHVAVGQPAPLVPVAAAASLCWELAGNPATDPATNYLGTRDAAALDLRVLGVSGLRLSPSAELFEGAPNTSNLRAGSSANDIMGSVRGGSVRGGGSVAGNVDPNFVVAPHRLRGHYGVIGGGARSSLGREGAGPVESSFATISGGLQHQLEGPNSRIGGGLSNALIGVESTIGGGIGHNLTGNWGTIAGGEGSRASIDNSSVGGGRSNSALGSFSAVGGGLFNTASGNASAVGGGGVQYALGILSATSGGRGSCAGGDASLAGGNQGKIRFPNTPNAPTCPGGVSSGDANGDEGTFMWTDAFDVDLLSTGPNQFLVRAAGGLWFGTEGPISIPSGRFLNTGTGAFLSSGGAWTNASSRELKRAFTPVDAGAALSRVLALPLSTWRYRADTSGTRHLGPIAEDFHAAFGLGADPGSIATVDADGVTLAAVQGLAAKAAAEHADIDRRLAELTTRLCAVADAHPACTVPARPSTD
jgi:hypothetical protein